jgi:hypothetical protein
MGAPFILQLCFCWIFTRWLRSRNLASFAESIEPALRDPSPTRWPKGLGKKLVEAARILAKKHSEPHRPSCGAARVCDRRWTWLRRVTSWGLAAVVPFLF